MGRFAGDGLLYVVRQNVEALLLRQQLMLGLLQATSGKSVVGRLRLKQGDG
ncbi:hypothetical protein [Pseudomonas sp. StFLB209]|uniref:hypothetical protein n=1 Tax=Pseudomonas sp. StFLB209 TaxID=1028989 RepID=UPI000A6B38B5|nr:hypothetical protein [Pseudomonas sp. StFLB209]